VRYIDESTVARRVSPEEVFRDTQEYLAQAEWQDPPSPDHAVQSPRVKTGYHRGRPAAYRIRLDDAPARYLTVLADRSGPYAAVAATHLTYHRTAALLLTGPWRASLRTPSILVVGAGRLGNATAQLAGSVFPGSRVCLYARSPGPPHRYPRHVEVLSGVLDSDFDVVVTATSSTDPLGDQVPLARARWLVVGGDVRTGAEIRGVPLAGRRQLTDHPDNARGRALLDHPCALSAEAKRPLPDVPSVIVICGGAGIDGYLAARFLNTPNREVPS
jgi:hypothetical protein